MMISNLRWRFQCHEGKNSLSQVAELSRLRPMKNYLPVFILICLIDLTLLAFELVFREERIAEIDKQEHSERRRLPAQWKLWFIECLPLTGQLGLQLHNSHGIPTTTEKASQLRQLVAHYNSELCFGSSWAQQTILTGIPSLLNFSIYWS